MFVKTLISGLLVASAASAATIIASDGFGDGDLANQDPPSSLQWFGSDAANPLTLSSEALVLPNLSALTASGDRRSGALAFFTPHASSQTLAEGQSLTLSFDITIPSGAGNGDLSFLFGFLNSGGTRTTNQNTHFNNSVYVDDVGYYAAAPLAGSSTNRNKIVRRNSTSNNSLTTTSNSGLTELGLPTSTPNFVAGGPYTYSLEIARTGADEVTLTSKFVGIREVGGATTVEMQRTDSAALAGTTGFDTIFIYSGNNPVEVTIDNVEVSFVPEPASMALLGLFSLVARRRRSA